MTKYCIIVDPELKDEVVVGHCLPTDLELCDAAEESGYLSYIIARTSFDVESLQKYLIKACITKGMWEINENDVQYISWLRNLIIVWNTFISFDMVTNHVSPKYYIRFIKSLIPKFSAILHIIYKLYLCPNQATYFSAGRRFYNEILSGLPEGKIDSSSIVIAQHSCGLQLYGWLILAMLSDIYNGPKIIIIIRYEVKFYEEFKNVFDLLSPYVLSGRVSYASDSLRLSNSYKYLIGDSIKYIPMQHICNNLYLKKTYLNTNKRPIVFASIGGARIDKGFETICDAIIYMHENNNIAGMKFIIHAHSITEKNCLQKLNEIKLKKISCLEIIEEPLDKDRYMQLFSEIDVVMLPYLREEYPSRSSGILAEAIVAGKVCIVTSNTWLADEVQARGSGILIECRSISDLVVSINNVFTNYYIFKHEAEVKAAKAAEWHNSKQAFQIIEKEFTI